jgi:hypothetical protein
MTRLITYKRSSECETGIATVREIVAIATVSKSTQAFAN